MHRDGDRVPRSAADPRPGGQPYYIAPGCRRCSARLVLFDRLENPEAPDDEVWHDEWICPVCRDGLYMDWPESEFIEIDLDRLLEEVQEQLEREDDQQ